MNIANILLNKNYIGKSIYSYINNKVTINGICNNVIQTIDDNGLIINYTENGKLLTQYKGMTVIEQNCLIYPSKYMQNWEKFMWKEGTILYNAITQSYCIFEKWGEDDYSTFTGRHILEIKGNTYIKEAKLFTKCSEEASENQKLEYIKYLNNATKSNFTLKNNLCIECTKSERFSQFKEGDIIHVITNDIHYVAIFKCKKTDTSIEIYAIHTIDTSCTRLEGRLIINPISRVFHASENDKTLLFEALKDTGVEWDADNKVIRKIKSNNTVKPFDHVLVRNKYDDHWKASMFFNYYPCSFRYECATGWYTQCIPYKGNEHLLGTINSPK